MKQEKQHFHIFERYNKDEEIEHYDVCIIGGGPSGLTAGIYSSRYGLHTSLITKDMGGMANLAEKIENYPGFEGSGIELMGKFWQQAKKFGTTPKQDCIFPHLSLLPLSSTSSFLGQAWSELAQITKLTNLVISKK